MRYLPSRRYGSIELDSSGGAGGFTVTSELIQPPTDQGLFVGISVRFDEGADAGQQIDDFVVAVYDATLVARNGAVSDDARLFASTSQNNVAHSDTDCAVRESFADLPQTFNGGLLVVITGTTNQADDNPHRFEVRLSSYIGVPA